MLRVSAIKEFEEDPSVSLLLISIRAGGVGLNLCVASSVFILEPWWNPAVEQQAIDRVHRIGSTEEVRNHHHFLLTPFPYPSNFL